MRLQNAPGGHREVERVLQLVLTVYARHKHMTFTPLWEGSGSEKFLRCLPKYQGPDVILAWYGRDSPSFAKLSFSNSLCHLGINTKTQFNIPFQYLFSASEI